MIGFRMARPTPSLPGVCSAPVIRDCDPPDRMEGHHGATGAALTLRFVVGIGEDLEDQMPTAARNSGSLEPLSNGRKVVDVDVPGPVVGRGPPRRSLAHVSDGLMDAVGVSLRRVGAPMTLRRCAPALDHGSDVDGVPNRTSSPRTAPRSVSCPRNATSSRSDDSCVPAPGTPCAPGRRTRFALYLSPSACAASARGSSRRVGSSRDHP